MCSLTVSVCSIVDLQFFKMVFNTAVNM